MEGHSCICRHSLDVVCHSNAQLALGAGQHMEEPPFDFGAGPRIYICQSGGDGGAPSEHKAEACGAVACKGIGLAAVQEPGGYAELLVGGEAALCQQLVAVPAA